jgi:hypothetical protein
MSVPRGAKPTGVGPFEEHYQLTNEDYVRGLHEYRRAGRAIQWPLRCRGTPTLPNDLSRLLACALVRFAPYRSSEQPLSNEVP